MTDTRIDLVVTRHKSLVDLLRELGMVSDDVVLLPHINDPSILKGKVVCGILPLHLASQCDIVIVPVLELRPEDRGKELSLAELKERFKGLKKFRVIEIK